MNIWVGAVIIKAIIYFKSMRKIPAPSLLRPWSTAHCKAVFVYIKFSIVLLEVFAWWNRWYQRTGERCRAIPCVSWWDTQRRHLQVGKIAGWYDERLLPFCFHPRRSDAGLLRSWDIVEQRYLDTLSEGDCRSRLDFMLWWRVAKKGNSKQRLPTCN